MPNLMKHIRKLRHGPHERRCKSLRLEVFVVLGKGIFSDNIGSKAAIGVINSNSGFAQLILRLDGAGEFVCTSLDFRSVERDLAL